MGRITRTKINKNKKDRLYTIITFFIAAPIISIVLGFFLVQYIILPRLSEEQNTLNPIEYRIEENKESEESNSPSSVLPSDGAEPQNETIDTEDSLEEADLVDNSSNEETEEKKDISFYSIQLGSFSSLANAESFLKELKGNNIDGYILKNRTFTVFSGEFNSKEDAYKYLDDIKKLYGDAFIKLVSKKE